MKRFFTKLTVVTLAMAAVVSLNSCTDSYDDSELKAAVEGLQSDVDDLESQLSVLQELIEASQNELKISSVETTESGYTMTFSDGSFVEVKNSQFQEVIKDYETETLTLVLNDGTTIKFDMVYEVRVLTFEDGEDDYWASLITDNEAGWWGLLAGEYSWCDEGNTELYSEFLTGEWGTAFYNGGHAVSNFTDFDAYDGCGYEHQLSIPNTSGNNGSENFCVHFGYSDDYYDNAPSISFNDGVARIVDHMYVTATSYFISSITYGDGYAVALEEGEYVNLVATGYNGDIEGETITFEIAKFDGSLSYTSDWEEWDLSDLGLVTSIKFSMTDGSNVFTYPGYFAFDDVAVRFYNVDESTPMFD